MTSDEVSARLGRPRAKSENPKFNQTDWIALTVVQLAHVRVARSSACTPSHTCPAMDLRTSGLSQNIVIHARVSQGAT
jgi:hypothetical protein